MSWGSVHACEQGARATACRPDLVASTHRQARRLRCGGSPVCGHTDPGHGSCGLSTDACRRVLAAVQVLVLVHSHAGFAAQRAATPADAIVAPQTHPLRCRQSTPTWGCCRGPQCEWSAFLLQDTARGCGSAFLRHHGCWKHVIQVSVVARWRQAPWQASQRWLQQTARSASAAARASPLAEPWPSFAPSPQRGVHENGVLCSHVQRQRRLSGRSSAAGHLKFLNSSGRVACFGAIFARKRTARGQDSLPAIICAEPCLARPPQR